jgi:hypothetical protein
MEHDLCAAVPTVEAARVGVCACNAAGSSFTTSTLDDKHSGAAVGSTMQFIQPAVQSKASVSTDVQFELEHVVAHSGLAEAQQRYGVTNAGKAKFHVCAIAPASIQAPAAAFSSLASHLGALKDRALRVVLGGDDCPRASCLLRAVERCTNGLILDVRAVVNALWLAHEDEIKRVCGPNWACNTGVRRTFDEYLLQVAPLLVEESPRLMGE